MAQHQSKYRHIYGEPAKPEFWYEDIKNPLTQGEGSYVKANPKFFAVAKTGGGGPLYVCRLDKTGRIGANVPMLSVHKGTTWDFDFHPFNNGIIATGSEDTKVAVTKFPVSGLTEHITSADMVLDGHQKKVVLVQWHPSANNILASASFDKCVKVWNVETGQCMYSYNDVEDNIYSLDWNYDGSQIAVTAKDKKLRIYDPRNTDSSLQIINESFDGQKTIKVFWVPKYNWIGATGFSKDAKRQLKIWDLKNLKDPLFKQDIDQAASVLMPWFDIDNSVLYLAGKGDGSIVYYELVNNDRILYNLSSYRSNEAQKGGGWVPKRGLDPMSCEIGRFLKLTNKSVIPISFIVPRKAGAEVFQSDIFPDAPIGKPALTADEYINGSNKDPILGSLDPSKRQDLNDDGGSGSDNVYQKKKSYNELEQENNRLKSQLKQVQQEIAKLKGETYKDENEEKQNDNNNNDSNNNEENVESPNFDE
jgi:coronin-1B/1C/6